MAFGSFAKLQRLPYQPLTVYHRRPSSIEPKTGEKLVVFSSIEQPDCNELKVHLQVISKADSIKLNGIGQNVGTGIEVKTTVLLFGSGEI